MSISDLLAQVEGKNKLRNGTFILQLVKYGDGSREDMLGWFKPKTPSDLLSSNPYSATLRLNGWSVLKKSPICGREECSHLQIHEVGLGMGWGALSLDPQRSIEAGICLQWPTDG